MDELLEQFVIEGRELVQQAVDGLLALEQAGYAAETVDCVFRAMHTLKGSAGLFDAAPFGAALHAAEDVIAAARDARQAPHPEALDALLDCCREADAWVEAMAQSAALPGDAGEQSRRLVTRLRAALEDGAPGVMPDVTSDVTSDWARALAPAPMRPAGPARDAPPRILRVDEGRIDGLAELVSELFAAKTRLSHTAAQAAGLAPDLARALAANRAEFDRLVGGLHRSVMRLRMVPLDHSLRRLPRIVREVAARLGREVRFTIEGAETEADRATVDGLHEPLLHVLRNALDHGVEPPEVRRAAGKPAQGRILLRAGLHGEQIVVTVTDDGAGIDPAALRHAAATRGLASAESLATMDDAAVLDLVFLPGFSTAKAVTDTSGRGVGMDAVRAAVQAVGGQVSIAPAAGGGTVVRLAVPQSLAITAIVIVSAGGEVFGVPIACIEETASLPRAAIRRLGCGRAFVLRERTIPLLSLAARLGGAPRADERADEPGDAPGAKVLIVSVAGQPVGLEVDRFGARMDVLVRPLHGLLAGLAGLRGSALLGDGRLLLVLDPPALLR